jgi:hypothetical protein
MKGLATQSVIFVVTIGAVVWAVVALLGFLASYDPHTWAGPPIRLSPIRSQPYDCLLPWDGSSWVPCHWLRGFTKEA